MVMVMVMMLGTAVAVQGPSFGPGPDRLRDVPVAAQEPSGSLTIMVSGVRSSSPQLKALIDDGVARSKTFTDLVRAIEATDGIVFVEEGRCPGGVAFIDDDLRVTTRDS